jgi:hypothetical protein
MVKRYISLYILTLNLKQDRKMIQFFFDIKMIQLYKEESYGFVLCSPYPMWILFY